MITRGGAFNALAALGLGMAALPVMKVWADDVEDLSPPTPEEIEQVSLCV